MTPTLPRDRRASPARKSLIGPFGRGEVGRPRDRRASPARKSLIGPFGRGEVGRPRDRRASPARQIGAASLLLAAVLGSTALARPAEKEGPPDPPFIGETLRYAMTILGVAGGDLTLSAQPAELAGRPVWKFELSAVSNDFLSKLFLVRDYMVSWVEPKTFRSLRFEKHTVEGKRVRDELTEFDYERGVAHIGDKDKRKTVMLKDATLDTLSSVYYLRTLALDADKPPEMQVFSDEPRSLKVEIQARERIATPAGTFATIRVEPKSTGSSLIGKGKNLVLWLTDDERKVPVQIKSKLKVGTLIGKLKSIEGDGGRPNTALTPAR